MTDPRSMASSPIPGLGAALLLGTLAACTVTRVDRPAGDAVQLIQRSLPTRSWELIDAEKSVIGRVVRFEGELPGQAAFYSVRNPWDQELGFIDEVGRAFAFRLHEEEARFLGAGSVLEGARAILGAGENAQLREVPLEEL